MEPVADDKFLNVMVRHKCEGFLPCAPPLLMLPLFAMELLHAVLFSVERSDLVGGPRGVEPP